MNQSLNVLIVDDDSIVRDVLSRELTSLGCVCDQATDGEEGLEQLRKRGYDLTFIDLRMPKRDGLSMLKAIEEEGLSTVAIISSGYGEVPDAVEAMRHGAFDFVEKPIDLDKLPFVLERAAKQRRTVLQADKMASIASEWRVIFDGMPDMVMAIDREMTILLCNRATVERTGLKEEEILGRHCHEVIGGHRDFAGFCPCAKAFETGIKESAELFQECCQAYFEVTCVPLKGPAGDYSTAIRIAHDINERKKSEETRAKLEEELRQSQKMQAIGELAGGVAHDFNNLLSGILVSAQLLAGRSHLTKEQEKYLDTILLMTRRASELTTQLLAFARKGRFQFVPIDVCEIICAVVQLLSHSVDKRIIVEQELNSPQSVIIGDPGQIQNALINLALNACDAMPDGGRLLFRTEALDLDEDYCRTRSDLTPGRYLSILVSDTGIGIPNRNIDRVFEPFFTTKPEGQGTGLGLAGVFGCAKIHRGEILVSSTVGQGTTFTFHLPLAPANMRAKELTKEIKEIVTGTGHILLVDDEEVVCDVETDALQMMGYRVTTYQDAPQALEFYRESFSLIDLVLMDMIMPKLSGWDAFREMKKINPTVRCLLTTGYIRENVPVRIEDEGILGFVEKPVDIVLLSQTVADALKK